jgi:hypothetical protein
MPPRWIFLNENEMLIARKYNDNKKKKLKYWREKYGLDIKDHQYEEFSKHSTKIKHIISILPFIKNIQTIN